MTDGCYPTEELEALAATPPGDPRRAHLARCPRCRADLAAYQAFMSPVAHPAEADPDDARARLVAAIDREILRAGERRPSSSAWRNLARPALRPVWGLAAVVLLVLVARQAGPLIHRPAPPIALRGSAEMAAGTVAARMETEGDGSVRFTWPAVPGAESYSIVLYKSDLSELGSCEAGAATTLRLDAQTIARMAGAGEGSAGGPGGAAAGSGERESILYWRLICLQGGEECARSGLGSLDVP